MLGIVQNIKLRKIVAIKLGGFCFNVPCYGLLAFAVARRSRGLLAEANILFALLLLRVALNTAL